jgi:hypothetical protein
MITRREAAIITAYTGVTLGDFDAFSDYATEKMGSIGSAQMASKAWWDELHEKSKGDFLSLQIEPQARPRPPFPGRRSTDF